MITSVQEFIRLRTSDLKEEYDRAASDEAPLEVWWELVRDHPAMKVWVAHNKTVPLEVLDALSTDVHRPSVCETGALSEPMMTTELEIDYLWIPHELGGHRADPYPGMRPMIRWQRHLREHLDRARDVECTSVAFDQMTKRGSAVLRLIADDPVPTEWLHEGSLIELLDGYRVIAVGRIAATRVAGG